MAYLQPQVLNQMPRRLPRLPRLSPFLLPNLLPSLMGANRSSGSWGRAVRRRSTLPTILPGIGKWPSP